MGCGKPVWPANIPHFANEDLKLLFERCDKDKSGVLSKQQMQKAIQQIDSRISSEMALRALTLFNVNDQITYPEFRRILRAVRCSIGSDGELDEAKYLFVCADKNDDSQVTIVDSVSVLTRLAPEVQESQLKEMFRTVDDTVDFPQFDNLVRKVRKMQPLQSNSIATVMEIQ